MTERTTTGHGAAQDAPGAPRAIVITLPIPYPLLTINARRRMHWREQARETLRQRTDAGWWLLHKQGKNIPQNILWGNIFWLSRVRVDIEVCPRKGMKRHDDSAIWEGCKPLFDAIEDVNLVRNDKQLFHGSLVWSEKRTGLFVMTLSQEV